MEWIENNLLILVIGTVISWIITFATAVISKSMRRGEPKDDYNKLGCIVGILAIAFMALTLAGGICSTISIILKIITYKTGV